MGNIRLAAFPAASAREFQKLSNPKATLVWDPTIYGDSTMQNIPLHQRRPPSNTITHPFVSLSPSYSRFFTTANIPAQWARGFGVVDHRERFTWTGIGRLGQGICADQGRRNGNGGARSERWA